MSDSLEASCLCGGVAWEAPGGLAFVTHCHCSYCRKSHGSALGTHGFAKADGFRWLRGTELVRDYESSPGFHRRFCGRCGSSVASVDGDRAVVPAGCVDRGFVEKPRAHIFAASRAPWREILDDLPQFAEYPPGMDEPVVAAPELPPGVPGETRGSCLCGRVAYVVTGAIPLMNHCHCGRCRKARSAPFANNAVVPADQFRFVRGEEGLASFKVPEAERFTHVFCDTCGSSAPRIYPTFVVVPAGGFDDPPTVLREQHIYVGSKPDWDDITDALPQHEGMPDPA